MSSVGRRGLIAGAVGVALAPLGAEATPEAMAAAIRAFTGGVTPREGRVALDIPPLVENGNAIPLIVSVESPMTEADHVVEIQIFNQKNPQPQVVGFKLTPRVARARVSTRIRLADSQELVAIAKMSDGGFWSMRASVVVTLAACVEEG